MGLFDRWTKPSAPAPETVEPEAANENVAEEAPKLEVVTPEPAAVAETTNTALAWTETKQANLKRTNSLFDKVNNYFRQQKESQGSGKWDKESPHYNAWKESTVQIKAAEWLVEESTKFDATTNKLNELLATPAPEILLAGSGASYEEKEASIKAAMDYDKKVAELKEELAFRASRIEDLENGYNERELTIAKLEAEMDGKLDGEDQNMWKVAEAAYQELVAAEDTLAELKRGFLARFRKAKEIADAKTRLAEAEAAVKTVTERMDDTGTLRGKAGAANKLAAFNSRQGAYNRSMASTGRGTMVGSK